MVESKCRKVVCPAICSVVGLSLIIVAAAIIGLGTMNTVINNMIAKELVTSLDSAAFSEWMNPAPPIYMQYWFFNVTNPDEVVKGEKPILKEVGPVAYQLLQPRFDVAFFTNDTVQYKYNHTLIFNQEHSAVLPTQPIIQLNLPLITVTTMLKQKKLPAIAGKLIAALVKNWGDSALFVNHTMEEFLFGYDDPIFTEINKIVKDLVPPQFGLFYGYNNTDDGVYLVNTGRKDITQVNMLERWNYNKTLSWWGTDQANMINGTDGVFMSSGIKKTDTLYIYNSDVCRSIFLTFEKETKVLGIDTWRFRVPAAVFESPASNIDNRGFCIGYPNNCLLDGVMDISVCQQGAPVAMSCPHFYMADKSYQTGVVGMHPDKKLHETFLDIEPMTGAIFSADKRLQMNVVLQPSDTFEQMKNLNDTIFPIAWLNESVVLDEGSADLFKTQVLRNIKVVTSLQYLVLAIGIFIFVLTIVILACNTFLRKDEKDEYKIINKSDSSSVLNEDT